MTKAKRTTAAFLSTLLLGVTTACENPIRKLERWTILERSLSLQSFRGTYVESGVAPGPQTTAISVQYQPLRVLARGKDRGGALLHFDNGALSMYYPQTAFGIRYRNLPDLGPGARADWARAEYDWHIEHYSISRTADTMVAGYPSMGLRYSPGSLDDPYVFQWDTFVQTDYAFPLLLSMKQPGPGYEMVFQEIEFQPLLNQTDLAFDFPPGTVIAEYDLSSRNWTLPQVRSHANFSFRLPINTPNFTLTRIVRVQGLLPAFTAYYEDYPYQTYYTQVRDYGLRLVPERGLSISGKAAPRIYRVNFAGAFRTIWFLEKGVYHTIVSSKPLSEVLIWLDGLSSSVGLHRPADRPMEQIRNPGRKAAAHA